jgi:hypothetical protein
MTSFITFARVPLDVFLDRAAPIVRLYWGWLQRWPDVDGLHYWMNRVASGDSLTQVSEAFATFAHATDTQSDAEFVAGLYTTYLARTADADGVAFYSGQLSTGAMTRAEVSLAFAQSAEASARLANPSLVCGAYIGLLGRNATECEMAAALAALTAGQRPERVIADIVLAEPG